MKGGTLFQSLRKGKYPSKFMASKDQNNVSFVSIPEKREIPFEERSGGRQEKGASEFQSLRKGKYPSKLSKMKKEDLLKLVFQSLRKGKYPSKGLSLII